MRALERLRSAGQSLWMDNVTREQIYDGSLMQNIEDDVITGSSFSLHALCRSLHSNTFYDDRICKKLNEDLYGEVLAFDLILEDVRHAASLLSHVFDRTDGIDGWATLPISPLKTDNPDTLLQYLSVLHSRLQRKNILITVPGFPDMLGAIEEMVFTEIPVNISLIYSCDQYLDAAAACLRGIERRIAAGLNPTAAAFISIPIFHLATILSKEMKPQEATRVSIAIARKIYESMRTMHTSQQWARVYNAGARPVRLIWDVSVDDVVTVPDISLCDYLIAPFTIASMTERTMEKFINNEHHGALMPEDGGDCEEILDGQQKKSGLSFESLATGLQDDAAALQVKIWITLLDAVARKSADLMQTKPVMISKEEC